MVVAAIVGLCVLLGTAIQDLSMILLAKPVFFSPIAHLGLDPI